MPGNGNYTSSAVWRYLIQIKVPFQAPEFENDVYLLGTFTQEVEVMFDKELCSFSLLMSCLIKNLVCSDNWKSCLFIVFVHLRL